MHIRDRVVELRRVRAGDLLPNPKNWRTHSKEQRNALQGMLAEVGYAVPAIARKLPDGRLMLLDGHLRADTLAEQQIPVAVLDVDEAEADKLLATIDPLSALAGQNGEALSSLLSQVQFESDAVNAMLAALQGEDAEVLRAGLTDPDDAPEPVAAPYVKPGDLYQLGDHRVRCGDSTVATDVAELLGGEAPHLMVTDPPYGVEYDANWRNDADRANGKPYGARAVGAVTNDDRADWSEAWALFPGDVAYCWHAGRHASKVQASLESAGFEIRSQIIWGKTRFAISRGHYHWQHEPCWYAVRKGSNGHWAGDRSQTTLWTIDHNKSETGHSTQKPVEAMRRPIKNNSTRGQSVYDPFLGSGTTLIAAEELKRKCRGMELSPAYVQVSIERWEAFTGKKAVRVNGAART